MYVRLYLYTYKYTINGKPKKKNLSKLYKFTFNCRLSDIFAYNGG